MAAGAELFDGDDPPEFEPVLEPVPELELVASVDFSGLADFSADLSLLDGSLLAVVPPASRLSLR